MDSQRLQPILICPELKRVIEKTESFKNDSNSLLNLLTANNRRLRSFEEILRQAVVFWSLSSVLQEMRDHPEIMNKFRPARSLPKATEDDRFFSQLIQAEAFTSASMVFRTWLSLIYLRSDKLINVLREIGRENQDEHLNSFVTLLTCDETRHIRNALSHGTFSAFAMEFEYTDEKYSNKISYDQLDRLNYQVYALLLNVWTATFAHSA